MGRCDRRSYARRANCWAARLVLMAGVLACVPPSARAQSVASTALGVQAMGPPRAALRDARVSPTAGSTTATPAPAAGVVNLNTASLEQLTRLPGIGPARARAVLDLRGRLKRFRRLEELMRVRGIGRKTFRRLLPLLSLSGETTLAQRAPRSCRE